MSAGPAQEDTCYNPVQNISLERSSCSLKKQKTKTATRRQSSVLHCEMTAAIGACPPTTPVGVLWYSSFTQIETEATVHILSVSMETAT